MSEKRKSRRSSIELVASFAVGDDAGPEHEAKIGDISLGGFCFDFSEKLKLGEELQVAVDLDLHEQIILNVKVVRVDEIKKGRKYRIGVQLTETEGPDWERFREFYRKQI
ncbi:MAG: hypothetical protein A3G91_05525 [Omnitrophica WOR_2 bacterium RIFCSPLOWO2_12_FULL_50_9]|nr:MAG: hypothetical protein A3D87_09240 [Omnitrophica WOR_2 bacterium RIFCSPHIGHO2_02_FULL_50_17]OGX41758.1 MAG: hypothetical protein A3G91_05525 [Omnitrophica WOR_2 bacterium RIFCSPLOWO2_12_FULL_50_9]